VRNRRTLLIDAQAFQDAPIFFVTTGLVLVISMMRSAVPHRIGMAGTGPAMTGSGRGSGDETSLGALSGAEGLHP
jgi:hypothetical protein